MKVLVAAPTSEKKDYCFKDWHKMVMDFDYHDYHLYMVDNSEDMDYVKYLRSLGIDADHVKREGSPAEYICNSQNRIRSKVLSGGYDYLFMLESDVFVDPWVLDHLVAYQLPMINITYLLYSGEKTTPCIQIAQHLGSGYNTKVVDGCVGSHLFTGECKNIREYKLSYDIHACFTGIGCSLIHYSILEKIAFRVDRKHDRKTGKMTFSDTFFHYDVNRAGFPNYLETSIIAKHKNNHTHGLARQDSEERRQN